jgi:hypothetical protein
MLDASVNKKIWVLTCMTLQIVEKPITLAMKIMVLTASSNRDVICPVR